MTGRPVISSSLTFCCKLTLKVSELPLLSSRYSRTPYKSGSLGFYSKNCLAILLILPERQYVMLKRYGRPKRDHDISVRHLLAMLICTLTGAPKKDIGISPWAMIIASNPASDI